MDRLDYTKGIIHRFEAIERFLEKYPEYQGRFGFMQIAVPSRTQIEDYRRVKAQVECAVERIQYPLWHRDGQAHPLSLRPSGTSGIGGVLPHGGLRHGDLVA